MANIKKLEMANALAARNDINITSSCFGLCTKAVYTPTGSKLVAFKQDFTPECASRIERLLDAPEGRVAAVSSEVALVKTAVSNVRLEGCMSEDGEFVALQQLRFMDYQYQPVSEPHFYQGEAAHALVRLLKS